MNVYEIYQDCNDRINKDEGGYLSVERFNRYSWIAQLRLLDWLSGDVAGVAPPEESGTQKNRDWISDFITPYAKSVVGGRVPKPEDYYRWETGYRINGTISNDCTEDDQQVFTIVPNTSITILDNSKFDLRADTYIELLKPTITKAITKIVGRDFLFVPADLGSIGIEYIRYPVKSKLAMTVDPVFNDLVYDGANSIDFEWKEYARPILVWFICNEFYNHTRDVAGMQMNSATPKSSRQQP